MNIKGLVFAAVAVCMTSALLADAAEKPLKKMTREERLARRAARIAAEGGMVERPVNGCVIRLKLDTDKLTKADLSKVADGIRSAMFLSVEVLARGETSTNDVGALVVLAEKGKDAPMLLCAPEENWSTVNLTRLWEDEPDEATAKLRVCKETWRALGYALGAANPLQQPCVMRPIRRARDLDKEKPEMCSPQPVMSMRQTASQMGFASFVRVTYRKACQEGWAAQPTNDVQRAIWQEVHTPPEAPLKLTK